MNKNEPPDKASKSAVFVTRFQATGGMVPANRKMTLCRTTNHSVPQTILLLFASNFALASQPKNITAVAAKVNGFKKLQSRHTALTAKATFKNARYVKSPT